MACARSSCVTPGNQALPAHGGMPAWLVGTSSGGSSVSRGLRASLEEGASEGPPLRFGVLALVAAPLIGAVWYGPGAL